MESFFKGPFTCFSKGAILETVVFVSIRHSPFLYYGIKQGNLIKYKWYIQLQNRGNLCISFVLPLRLHLCHIKNKKIYSKIISARTVLYRKKVARWRDFVLQYREVGCSYVGLQLQRKRRSVLL